MSRFSSDSVRGMRPSRARLLMRVRVNDSSSGCALAQSSCSFSCFDSGEQTRDGMRPRWLSRPTRCSTRCCAACDSDWLASSIIFARADGSPWPPSQFSSEFARLARKHAIDIRFHDLRHTHATHLLKAGVPVRVASERLGHAAASITLDAYAYVLPGQQ
jgi:Phage integrase family